MEDFAQLYETLGDDHFNWVMCTATKKNLKKGDVLIEESSEVDSFYIIDEGGFFVTVSALPKCIITTLGIGNVIGEMEYLNNLNASAAVTAQDSAVVRVLSFEDVRKKEQEDKEFAVKLYKGLAQLVNSRLIHSVGQFAIEKENSPHWRKIAFLVKGLKTTVDKTEALLLKNKKVTLQEADEVANSVTDFAVKLDELIGDNSGIEPAFREQLGSWVRQEMLPYILLTNTMSRAYTKPQGHAGDYLTINDIYASNGIEHENIGQMLDNGFFAISPSISVKNRRKMLTDKILELIDEKQGETLKVTVLASGPAREIIDAFDRLEDKKLLKVTIIDNDVQALAFVGSECKKRKIPDAQIKMIKESMLDLARGFSEVNLTDQDFVYSMGLTDYFKDKLFNKMLNFIYAMLKDGGMVWLGNYHKKDKFKTFLKYVVKWNLQYRTEDDMNRLYENSDFKKPCNKIIYDDQGIDMFGEGIR